VTPSTRPAGDHQPEVWLDGRQLRILAHPLRARLLAALRLDGPATATGLAQTLGTNTGATSYHLRQLADVGLVVEEFDRGSARQRYWRAAHANHGFWDTDHSDPDERAALDWLAGDQVSIWAEEAARWRAARTARTREWQDAASFDDYVLRLPPGRLRALNDDLQAVIERYLAESTPVEEGAEQVIVFTAGFPRARSAPPTGGEEPAGTGPEGAPATGRGKTGAAGGDTTSTNPDDGGEEAS
jgi:DNA-binding transcriptional ArsR family regulator